MSISMDVLFHLPDDRDYFEYLDRLFNSAVHHVVIYSTDTAEGRTARHVFRRKFTDDIAERFLDWELKMTEPPLREGLASFFVYGKVGWLHCQSRSWRTGNAPTTSPGCWNGWGSPTMM